MSPDGTNDTDTLFDANGYDDIIFGGLGNDFLHGGSGDDAIIGAEALPLSYVQVYAGICPQDQELDACVIGLMRLDYGHPWNPGDVLHFGADTNPWHSNGHVQSRLGEFLLYNEYDPRRAILFNADGTVWRCQATSQGGHTCTRHRRRAARAGPVLPQLLEQRGSGHQRLRRRRRRAGARACSYADARSDGDDVIFGDLGNDWLVGGTGKDTLWGGWGNDLMNADDVLVDGLRPTSERRQVRRRRSTRG